MDELVVGSPEGAEVAVVPPSVDEDEVGESCEVELPCEMRHAQREKHKKSGVRTCTVMSSSSPLAQNPRARVDSNSA